MHQKSFPGSDCRGEFLVIKKSTELKGFCLCRIRSWRFTFYFLDNKPSPSFSCHDWAKRILSKHPLYGLPTHKLTFRFANKNPVIEAKETDRRACHPILEQFGPTLWNTPCARDDLCVSRHWFQHKGSQIHNYLTCQSIPNLQMVLR